MTPFYISKNTLNMDPSWINFGSAQKVRPSELSGLGANIRSLAIGIGIIGLSTASLKLPNVDTAPARIDIGGLSASFGIRASAFYAGGEFRVYKQEGLPRPNEANPYLSSLQRAHRQSLPARPQ
jgi:hypothetical protein